MKRVILILLTACLLADCFCACGQDNSVYTEKPNDFFSAMDTEEPTDFFSAIAIYNQNHDGLGRLVAITTRPNEVTVTGKIWFARECLKLILEPDLNVIWKATLVRDSEYFGQSIYTDDGRIEFSESAFIEGPLELESTAVISGGTIEGNIACRYGSLTVTGGVIEGSIYCKRGFEITGGTIKGNIVSEASNVLAGATVFGSYADFDIAGGIIEGNIYCGNSNLNITEGIIKGNISSEEKADGEGVGGFSIGIVDAPYLSWPGNARIFGGTVQGNINYNGDIMITNGVVEGKIAGKSVKYSEDEPEEAEATEIIITQK